MQVLIYTACIAVLVGFSSGYYTATQFNKAKQIVQYQETINNVKKLKKSNIKLIQDLNVEKNNIKIEEKIIEKEVFKYVNENTVCDIDDNVVRLLNQLINMP